ncbi:MAG: T9SS type A sorting domain-containing protein, partial [Bacteroidia bacterium]|nr:T9SS type A sorting domain-containing protein [Bacteroidia bacterium]
PAFIALISGFKTGRLQAQSSPASPANAVSQSFGTGPAYIHASRFYVTKALRDLPVALPHTSGQMKEAADRMREKANALNRARFKPVAGEADPVVQTVQGTRTANAIAPAIDYEADSMMSGTPPDPNGAVGPNNYVESINAEYHVYDKAGHSIAGPVDFMTLFPGSEDDGDPIVLYDKFADRWVITEFQLPASPPYYLLVAVSKTNDPAGQYYTWWFNTGSNYPDYPKYSIWSDGYYSTSQWFNGPNTLSPQLITVLERNRMLAGSPSAGMIVGNLPAKYPFGGNNSLSTAPKTFDCDGVLPPYGTPNYLVFFNNVNSGGYSNSIYLYSLATDTTAKTITSAIADSLPTQPFNAFFNPSGYQDISQPAQPNSLDALDGTFNFRVGYMKFTGYNSVVLCNTVNTGSMVAGIRWYELRQAEPSGTWSIYQQATYAPADGISRWNGSICMDNYGNISLAYNVSSNSVYPGIRYTGRLASDPPGTMNFAEQTAVNGSASGNNSWTQYNRWGDYSNTTLDPTDGVTFWHCNEYVGPAGGQNTRIFSFKIDSALGVPEQQKPQAALTVYQNGQELNVLASQLPSNDKTFVDLFALNGKQLNSQQLVPASGNLITEIDVTGLATGIYLVRIGNVNFQVVKKVFVKGN